MQKLQQNSSKPVKQYINRIHTPWSGGIYPKMQGWFDIYMELISDTIAHQRAKVNEVGQLLSMGKKRWAWVTASYHL